MALIKKENLYYKDYSWSVIPGDSPRITGEPDNTLLNRKEGYEMIYFLNKFSAIHKFKNIASATKTERMIREKVPTNIHSQLAIQNWLEENWKNFSY